LGQIAKLVFISFALTTLTAQPDTAYAETNMRKASYSTEFVDIRTADLEVVRHYDSRSLYNGLFGFGWCSNLESTLKRGLSGEWRLSHCDHHSHPTQALRSKDGWATKEGETRMTFDPSGRLLSLTRDKGETLALIYGPTGLLRGAATGRGKEMRLELDDTNRKVTAVKFAGKSAAYKYQNQDLISVTNSWANEFTFHYDSLHNLISTNYPDDTKETMTYDADLDRLLSYRERNGCKEVYDYRGSTHLTATSVKYCVGKPQVKSTFEFWHHKQANGKYVLERSRVTQGTISVAMTFHPKTGAVIAKTQVRNSDGRFPALSTSNITKIETDGDDR
jgi:hypothetical protein